MTYQLQIGSVPFCFAAAVLKVVMQEVNEVS